MSLNEQIVLTRAQVREVDRRAIEEYGIPGMVLMENAGRNASRLILEAIPHGGRVAIICGRGNNGGDGFVIARHLFNARIQVELYMACDPGRLSGEAAANAHIVGKMGIATHAFDTTERIDQAAASLRGVAVIVDAVLGTGFSGTVRSPLDRVIDAINQQSGARVISVDLPSGLDCDTGLPSNATVRADETITFVARKTGFDTPGAAAYTGRIHVADIGAPRTLVQAVLSGGGSG